MNSLTQNLDSMDRVNALNSCFHNEPAEQSVLGCILLYNAINDNPVNNEAFNTAQTILKPEHFYNAQYRAIYQTMQVLASKGQAFDPISICEVLEQGQHAATDDLLGQLIDLQDSTPSHANVKAYATHVLESAGKREVLKLADSVDYSKSFSESAKNLHTSVQRVIKDFKAYPEPQDLKPHLHPVKPMRPEMIPVAFRDWLVEQAELKQVPLDFFAAPTIAALGSVISTRCGVYPKKHDLGMFMVPNLWGLIVGYPGLIKSASLSTAVKPLEKLEKASRKAYEEQAQNYERIARRKKMLLKELEKNTTKQGVIDSLEEELEELESFPQPTERRFLTSDATGEKLGELLANNKTDPTQPNRGILLLQDELSSFFAMIEKHDEKSQKMRALFLKAWNGTNMEKVDRVGRGSIMIERLCLSVVGAIQPDKLMQFFNGVMSKNQNDGFLDRLQLAVYPDQPEGEWQIVDKPTNKAAFLKAYDVFEKLAGEGFYPSHDDFEEDEFVGLHFSDEAQKLFYEWWEHWENKKIRNSDDSELLIQAFVKYRKLLPTLALIFHLANTADGLAEPGTPISAIATTMAMEWVDYLESHARRIYALSSNNAAEKAAYALSKKLKAGKLSDGFTVRDVVQKRWAGLSSSETIHTALSELESAYWIFPIEEDKPIEKRTGRKPNTKYLINPLIKTKCIT